MEALNVQMFVAWWRMNNEPKSPLIRSRKLTSTYRLRCSESYESYWRETNYYKTISNKRNRCKEFTPEVNSPGSAAWVIKNWCERWSDPPNDYHCPEDRIAVANYLEQRGHHFTVSLLDKGKLIGGATMTVHQQDVVAGVLYYEMEYRKCGLGVRLIDLSCSLAVDYGFEHLDIGGGQDYKKNWAPQEGEHCWFTLCPASIYYMKKVVNVARKIYQTTANYQN